MSKRQVLASWFRPVFFATSDEIPGTVSTVRRRVTTWRMRFGRRTPIRHRTVTYPRLHPNCRCTIYAVFIDETNPEKGKP